MDGGYCFHPFLFVFVCLFVCEQYYGKTPRRISTKLGGEVKYGPRIMPLDLALGPKSNMAAIAAILKKYLNFFVFAFLHVLSDFQPPQKQAQTEL